MLLTVGSSTSQIAWPAAEQVLQTGTSQFPLPTCPIAWTALQNTSVAALGSVSEVLQAAEEASAGLKHCVMVIESDRFKTAAGLISSA